MAEKVEETMATAKEKSQLDNLIASSFSVLLKKKSMVSILFASETFLKTSIFRKLILIQSKWS